MASKTALAVARHRAVHVLLDGGVFFNDKLAQPLLGVNVLEWGESRTARRARRKLKSATARKTRFFLCQRARLAQEAVEQFVDAAAGHQVVLLGAGLDTFAYTTQLPVTVFEVDTAASQADKLRRLATCNIDRGCTRYVALDLERDHASLFDGLRDAGFDSGTPCIALALGVLPYLSNDAAFAVLERVASLEHAHVVFDYGEPCGEGRGRHAARARSVAADNEPWLSYFDTGPLLERLRAMGFTTIVHMGPRELAERFFAGSLDWSLLSGPSCCIVHASK